MRRIIAPLLARVRRHNPHAPPISSISPTPLLLGHPFRVLIRVAKTLVYFHLFWTFGFSISPCQGASMLPTFQVIEESILISHLHRHGRGVRVGDLVSYTIPTTHQRGVKRVLGMPGDYVLTGTPEPDLGRSQNMIQVPNGHCWIVGDNLDAARDSRDFGPLPLALVTGQIIARMQSEFPYIRRIKNPLDVAES